MAIQENEKRPQRFFQKAEPARLSSNDVFLRMMSKVHSRKELAFMFGYSPEDVDRVLNTSSVSHPLSIDVAAPPQIPDNGLKQVVSVETSRKSVEKEKGVPENEKAFFLGLRFGDYQNLTIEGFVVMATRSDKGKEILRKTLATRGHTNSRDSRDLRVYLQSPEFDFMKQAKVPHEILDNKSTFGPFFSGFATARLPYSGERISLEDSLLLQSIYYKFNTHFGFSLGRYVTEKRKGKSGLGVILIKDLPRIYDALRQEDSVSSLPFFKEIPGLSQEFRPILQQ